MAAGMATRKDEVVAPGAERFGDVEIEAGRWKCAEALSMVSGNQTVRAMRATPAKMDWGRESAQGESRRWREWGRRFSAGACPIADAHRPADADAGNQAAMVPAM